MLETDIHNTYAKAEFVIVPVKPTPEMIDAVYRFVRPEQYSKSRILCGRKCLTPHPSRARSRWNGNSGARHRRSGTTL